MRNIICGIGVLLGLSPHSNAQGLTDTRRSPMAKMVKITMIPYYAWDNRGADVDMTVWLPVRK